MNDNNDGENIFIVDLFFAVGLFVFDLLIIVASIFAMEQFLIILMQVESKFVIGIHTVMLSVFSYIFLRYFKYAFNALDLIKFVIVEEVGKIYENIKLYSLSAKIICKEKEISIKECFARINLESTVITVGLIISCLFLIDFFYAISVDALTHYLVNGDFIRHYKDIPPDLLFFCFAVYFACSIIILKRITKIIVVVSRITNELSNVVKNEREKIRNK